MQLSELLDCPQICHWRLLVYRYERARALAGPEHAEKLNVMVSLIKEGRMKEGLVPQINDCGYAGPVIADRFQVMASVIGNDYYICDHERHDLLLREGGPASNVKRFTTIEEAEEFIRFTFAAVDSTAATSSAKEIDMAKLTSLKAARKAAAEADAAISPKTPRIATAAPPKASRGNAEALKKAREARGPSAASRFRELILDATTLKGVKTSKLTDAEIFAKVAAEFGLDEKKASYVAWYRKDLAKKGGDVPVARV